jgi:hypothetical protein
MNASMHSSMVFHGFLGIEFFVAEKAQPTVHPMYNPNQICQSMERNLATTNSEKSIEDIR